jgi:hypothetical protein
VLTSLYERIAATPEGERGLAAARLRRRVATLVYMGSGGLDEREVGRSSGLSRRAARRLRKRPGAATIGDLAAWLWACGYEVGIRLVPAGQPRQDILARRAAALGEQQSEGEHG